MIHLRQHYKGLYANFIQISTEPSTGLCENTARMFCMEKLILSVIIFKCYKGLYVNFFSSLFYSFVQFRTLLYGLGWKFSGRLFPP